ncbi:hypothetical protein GCM10010307_04250 [Streptomyces vastus]|uniref:Uncharacterized protein n=1 Tax=Streptomyces vastus TaxID=285451 RepID=A0ABN3QA53_9ACTN
MVSSGPPLAGTDTDTNEARRDSVTRIRGEGPWVRAYAELRCGDSDTGGCGDSDAVAQIRPRHSSSNVIASDVPGLPSASL